MTPTDLLELIRKHRVTPAVLCRIFGLDPQHHATADKVVAKLIRKKYEMRHAAVAIEYEAAHRSA